MEQETTLSSRYDSSQVESRWYAAWESAGLFKPSKDVSGGTFTITIPPPNITGSLHMGHSLCYPTQDAIGRYQRLRGKSVLILPGQDHAGIATQSVVEKMLRKEGTSGSKLGREKFIERVWDWRKESGDTILSQFRELGCAFDWDRGRFTLDDDYVQAVLKIFIDWFERGLIYRGKRVVNWDPVLKTSVSDIETERKIIRGKLYHIRYPFVDGSGEVVIATTRPETMLGDVAVAVHPSDKRYEGKIGKMIKLPLVGREIPLIADGYPDPEFGTGAVKITPAHDPNDFEVGVRHNLEMPVVLDENAKVVEGYGPFSGLDRYAARKEIVAALEDQGSLVKVEDHEIAMIVSERSGENVEPLLSEQWFVSQTALAGPAIEAVKQGKIKIQPSRYEKVYLDWMENIRDWCISRQLWWGHRIPIYTAEDGSVVAALSWEDAEKKAGKKIVDQESDVLDTWFSSGLWPFATLGWPGQTDDLKNHYPTSILVTDRNILYLWVARMVMMGLDTLGEIPFHEVLIHATVMTEDGRRMSKSLGTGVDPRTVIEKIGADALRYTLLSQAGDNQEIRYSERRTEDARNFCNKLWNASRFILMNLEGGASVSLPDESQWEIVDRWLLNQLSECWRTVSAAYDNYDFQTACTAMYRFFWSELCDWYIEVSKARLSDEVSRAVPQWVLVTALETFLKMMHPIMPHITEEIYANLPIANRDEFLMISRWPDLPSQFSNPGVASQVQAWFEQVRGIRALRAELGIAPNVFLDQLYFDGDLRGGELVIQSQTKVKSLVRGKPDQKSVATTISGVDFAIPFEGLIDSEKELTRLEKEVATIEANLSQLQKRLSNEDFVARAKPDVVERDRALAAELMDKLERTKERIKLFSS